MVVVLILAVGLLVAATAYAGLGLVQGRDARRAIATVRQWAPQGDARRRVRRRLPAFDRLVSRLEPLGRRAGSRKAADVLRTRLAAAGLAGRLSPEAFLGLRLALTVVASVVAVLLVSASAASFEILLLAIVLVVAAWVLPGFAIGRIASNRSDRIGAALPDALDLLAVTVEAGLGLYGAITRLVETTTGPLSDEFALVLADLRVGQSSERALRTMAERVDSPEVSAFVRSLIQGEKLGLSLASTLRNLADDTRRRRRAIAEERASKAPVKMLVPAAIFIFPTLFLVILGPAVLELRKYL